MAPLILIVTFLVPQYFIDILNYDFWRMQKRKFDFSLFFFMGGREETIPRVFNSILKFVSILRVRRF